MSELKKFLFDGLPVRGIFVRLTSAWTEILRRRESTGAYPPEVVELLGEMVAGGTLLQASIKFDGALILQIFGDGPVKLAVVEVQHDLALRAMANVTGVVAPTTGLSGMVNVHNQGRCAITLDPQSRFPGQQPYQGVVPLADDRGGKLERFSEILEQYMRRSEQLDSTLVLAANDHVAAGLLIQKLPTEGVRNIEMQTPRDAATTESDDDYKRIAILAASLKKEELLTLDAKTILRRLFWEEKLLQFDPLHGEVEPRFACNCSRHRVSGMIMGLGAKEAQSILTEKGTIDVRCEFCGLEYRFDPVDVKQLFINPSQRPPGSPKNH